jgi:hypothetical protein
MKLLFLIVADHISYDNATGKLNIIGAFGRIHAKQFPTRHPAMSVVVRLGAEIGDRAEDHNLIVALTDEDGAEILKISGPFKIPFVEGNRPEFNLVLDLRDLLFPHSGVYAFKVFVDDDEEPLGSTRLELVLQ